MLRSADAFLSFLRQIAFFGILVKTDSFCYQYSRSRGGKEEVYQRAMQIEIQISRQKRAEKTGNRIPSRLLLGAVLFGCVCAAVGCKSPIQRCTAVGTAMGTVVSQTIYTDREDVTDQVTELLEALEQDTLSWRAENSEVATVNAKAGSGEYVPLSDGLRSYLTELLTVSVESGGAFDVTIGAVTGLWNIDAWAAAGRNGEGGEACIPDREAVKKVLELTGYEKVQLSGEGILLPEGMRLDLGAVGKGIACDEVAALLGQIPRTELPGAVISVGGSILTYGEKPDGTPWQVAVTDPFSTAGQAGVLSLTGQWCVSTSGDYERYLEVEGRRYHHIMNPATGYPADSGVRSATVVCKSGILSDALSTACFVLGTEEGLRLAEHYEAEALFITTDGSYVMTEGMEALFHR